MAQLKDIHANGYGSELEEVQDAHRKGALLPPPKLPVSWEAIHDLSSRSEFYSRFVGMDAYSRHKKFVNDYVLFYGNKTERPPLDSKTDEDVLREQYRFIRTEKDDDASNSTERWEKELAKKYYEKLFKEYAIADLSRFKEHKVGLRWRVEKEVVSGKGQFICGGKGCEAKEALQSFEVNFVYVEQEARKNALVKVRLCPSCAQKLNHKHLNKRKREEKKAKKKQSKLEKKQKKKARAQDPQIDAEKGQEAGASEAKEELPQPQGAVTSDAWRSKPIEEPKDKEQEFEEYFRGLFP